MARTDYVLALRDGHLRQLTDALALPPRCGIGRPSGKWLHAQERQMSRLPRPVLRPSGFLRRLAIRLSETGAAAPVLPPAAVLCPTHRPLHPWLIRGMFNLLAAEVTIQCDRLASYLSKGAGLLEDKQRKAVGVTLGRLRSINALWLEEEHFRKLFGEQPTGWNGGRLRRVESGCEACILAAVGSRGELLASLRANLLVRVGRREPRLLRVVEHWIRWFGTDADGVLEGSNVMAKELRGARKIAIAKRGSRRRRTRSKISTDAGSLSSRAGSGERSRRESCVTRQYADRNTLVDPWTAAGAGSCLPTPTGTGDDPFDDSCRLSEGSEGQEEAPVCEGSIAEWYARSEAAGSPGTGASASERRSRSVHPAFQAGDAPPCYDEEPPLETDAAPVDTILKTYGGSGESDTGDSWISCSVRTSEPPSSTSASPPSSTSASPSPPPQPETPPVPDFDKRASSYTVPIYASSSVYDSEPGQGGPPPSLVPGAPLPSRMPSPESVAREWRAVEDRTAVFRDPFADGDEGEEAQGRGGGGRKDGESRQVSPGTLPDMDGGWI